MKSKKELDKYLKGLIDGDTLALSRLISLVENNSKYTKAIMDAIYSKVGSAWKIGVTGPPGAGKSSLIDCLVQFLRTKKYRVGIIAVDPSSPFTGGAVLGDRIRMQKHAIDPDVFIRSVGSRGSHGGLSASVYRIAGLYDAAHYDYTILETVGVGQTELDVIKIADTTIVVLVPESGDSIQTMKAGLMEIADIFVVNKEDRPGADVAAKNLRALVEMSSRPAEWKQPVILTNSVKGTGIDELFKYIEEHRDYSMRTGRVNEKRKILRRQELVELIQSGLRFRVERLLKTKDFLKIVKEVENGKRSPYQVIKKIMPKI